MATQQLARDHSLDDQAKQRIMDAISGLAHLAEDEYTWNRIGPGGKAAVGECGRYLNAARIQIEETQS